MLTWADRDVMMCGRELTVYGGDRLTNVNNPENVTMINCPHCGKPINAAAMLGSISSPAKARAARENAKRGGWPKGRKRGKTKRVRLRPNADISNPASK